MARPESINDLPDRDELITVVEIHDAKLTELDSVQLMAVGGAAKALAATFITKREYGSIRYCRMPLDAELKDRLERVQALWDYREKSYNAALLDNEAPAYDFERRNIDEWARKEGLEPIDWDAIDRANDKAESAVL